MSQGKTLVTLAAAAVLTASLVTPAQAASITLTSSPTSGVWGTNFQLRGFTSAGATVKLQRRTATTSNWSDIGSQQQSDSNGFYSFYDQPAASADYRAIVLSDGSTSNTAHVNVAVGVHLAVGRSGGSALFTGKVLPAHARTKVILQMLDGVNKRWNTVKTVTLSSTSRYSMLYRATGRRMFRTAWATQDLDHIWNTSAYVWVTWTT